MKPCIEKADAQLPELLGFVERCLAESFQFHLEPVEMEQEPEFPRAQAWPKVLETFVLDTAVDGYPIASRRPSSITALEISFSILAKSIGEVLVSPHRPTHLQLARGNLSLIGRAGHVFYWHEAQSWKCLPCLAEHCSRMNNGISLTEVARHELGAGRHMLCSCKAATFDTKRGQSMISKCYLTVLWLTRRQAVIKRRPCPCRRLLRREI